MIVHEGLGAPFVRARCVHRYARPKPVDVPVRVAQRPLSRARRHRPGTPDQRPTAHALGAKTGRGPRWRPRSSASNPTWPVAVRALGASLPMGAIVARLGDVASGLPGEVLADGTDK